MALLGEAELDWLNKYRTRVNREVRPHRRQRHETLARRGDGGE
jgi:hypothetical protein